MESVGLAHDEPTIRWTGIDRCRDHGAKDASMRVTRAARSAAVRRVAVALVLSASMMWSRCVSAQPVACAADPRLVTDALARIRRAVDPCGESAQVREILAQLERCAARGYQVCASTAVDRNVFDRPGGTTGQSPFGMVTWNPELRTELEPARDGDPTTAVHRDPAASLLHELVHVVQECNGLNPGEHELDAVRIENAYRRAAGLRQRRGYGDTPLPAEMVRVCAAASCPCSTPDMPWLARSSEGSEGAAAAPRRSGDRPE